MLAAIVSNALNSDFFHLVKLPTLEVCSTKPAGNGHTSPGNKFAERKEVSHSSTNFTCRVSVATIDKKSHSFRNMGSCSSQLVVTD